MSDLDDLANAARSAEARKQVLPPHAPPAGIRSAPIIAAIPQPTYAIQQPVVPVPAGLERVWTVHDQGRQFGPHTEAELASLVGVGTISTAALVWREGSPRWVPISAIIPVPATPLNYPSAGRPGVVSISGVRTPLLISAIGNILVGLIWASTCFGIVFTVPMVILCIFEFTLYAKADRLHPHELANKAQVLGIFEIVVGLFNTIALICGILVLIHASKLRKTT